MANARQVFAYKMKMGRSTLFHLAAPQKENRTYMYMYTHLAPKMSNKWPQHLLVLY